MPKVKTKDDAQDDAQDADLEKRVETLELEVRELRRLLRSQTGLENPGPDDWMKSFGRFKDDPTYDEALRLGRSWRLRQPKC